MKPNRMRVNKDKALIGILAFLLAFYAYRYIIVAPIADPSFGGDFRIFYEASKKLIVTGSPYGDPRLEPAIFVYPISSIVLWLPFSFLNFSDAVRIWNAINLVALVLVCFMVVNLARELIRGGTSEALVPAITLLLCYPTGATFWRGQVDGLITFLVLGSLYAFKLRQDVLGGLLASSAAIVKLTPGLLVILFLLKRRWKAVYAFIALFGIAFILPVVFKPTLLAEHYTSLSIVTSKLIAWSYATWAIIASTALLLLIYVLAMERSGEICYAATLCSANVISPIFGWHHLMPVIPLISLSAYSMSGPLMRVTAIAILTLFMASLKMLQGYLGLAHEEYLMIPMWAIFMILCFVRLARLHKVEPCSLTQTRDSSVKADGHQTELE